jgi:hypothetical protein
VVKLAVAEQYQQMSPANAKGAYGKELVSLYDIGGYCAVRVLTAQRCNGGVDRLDEDTFTVKLGVAG